MLQDEYRTGCGGRICLTEGARKHLEAHPEVADFLAEAISGITLPKDQSYLAVEVNLGRALGPCTMIETRTVSPDNLTTFAVRKGRDKPSRVVVVEWPPPCETIVICAIHDQNQEDPRRYLLATAYVGCRAPDEPWNPRLESGSDKAREALEYWCSHAMVWNPDAMGDVFVSTWAAILAG